MLNWLVWNRTVWNRAACIYRRVYKFTNEIVADTQDW